MNKKDDVICNVPVTFLFKDSIEGSAQKGTIFLNHGFRSDRKGMTKDMNILCDRDFLIVSVDSVGHGERLYPDFDEKFDDNNPDMEKNFFEIVKSTSLEISDLIDDLNKKNMIHMGKIGISGVSMGGYVTYQALCMDTRLKAGVPVLGSPLWSENKDKSPFYFPEMIFPRALLSITAGKDRSVPPENVFKFHEKLTDLYRNNIDRVKHINYPESAHAMRFEDWLDLWSHAADWFEKWL
ncbi:dienelactone hydrolase family protein [bacterium]|nr:dienelactone hydrolase family protein [bacterium]